MEGFYLFCTAAWLLVFAGGAWGYEDMCGDIQKTFTDSVSLSHQSYPAYTDRKHCQCNVTTDYNADILLQLQLHREDFDPTDNSGCSPRLMVAVVDREMQESAAALRDRQVQEMEGILRPSVGVCPMPHAGPFTATRSYVAMRSSQQLTVTFQNPSAHMTRFSVSLSANPSQEVRVRCGAIVAAPPVLVEATGVPIAKRGSEIGAIVACVIIAIFIVAIFIIAYCKVRRRDRNRRDSGTTPNRTRKSSNDNKNNGEKNTPDKGRGNLGFEGTPRSSAGDVSKSRPNDLNGQWRHPPSTDGVDNDLIPHDFMRRIGTGGSSPRHINHFHHEPASVPVRAEPHILPPSSALGQPGYPHQPIMDPIFAVTPDRYTRAPYPRGSRVSFPDDQDSFDSPYAKPVPGSPSINAPSDSGYNGSDVHVPPPNHDDTTSEMSGIPDDSPLNHSPDSGRPSRPMSQSSGPPGDRSYTPDQLQKYPLSKMYPQHPYQPNEYANLGFDPEEQDVIPTKTHPNIPIREYPGNTSPFPTKEYPQVPNGIPVNAYPSQSSPIKEYPTERLSSQPMKGISPSPYDQQPHDQQPYDQHPNDPYSQYPTEPTKEAPKKKKKKAKPGKQQEPVAPHAPIKAQSPQVPMHSHSPYLAPNPESDDDEPITPVNETPVEREFTPDPMKQFKPIGPDPNSPCTSPASMISGSWTPTGRSPFMRSPLIPPLGLDEPYIPPSPWRLPYVYKQEPLMYIDDTDSESVVSSMSTRDLYVRSHKELQNMQSPVMRDPYRQNRRTPVINRPETISETDV